MEIADYVNESPPSSNLGDLTLYLQEEKLSSAIDTYIASIGAILSYGTVGRLGRNDFIGRLLVLGLVSAAEGYIRSILSFCIEACPVAQSKAATQTINLGGLLWHGKTGFSRSAFEHGSFTSRDELTKAFRNYIGFPLEDATFKAVLDQYQAVCQIRHGIVHGDGVLPGKNAVQLDVPRYSYPVRIVVRYPQLQEVAAVINTLVFTLNRELFAEMCKRWAIDWRKRKDWNPELEGVLFARIWAAFHSSTEKKTRKGRSAITRGRCLADVKIQYGLS